MREAKFVGAVGGARGGAGPPHGKAPAPAASATFAAPPTPAAPPPAPTNATYTTYQNPTSGFTVDVPSFFNSPRSVLNDSGQQWTWAHRAQMTAAAVPGGGKSIKDWFGESEKSEGYASGSMTGPSSFIGRGKANGKVYWQKTLMQDGKLYSVRLDYDEDLRASFEPIIARIDSSLKAPVSSTPPPH
jgi:hypothetical protein